MASMTKEIRSIYIKAVIEESSKSGDIDKEKKAGWAAVEKAGYYLDNGKWKKRTGKESGEKKIEVNDRSDENKKLSKIKIKSGMGVA